MPERNCLRLGDVGRPGHGEVLGREARDAPGTRRRRSRTASRRPAHRRRSRGRRRLRGTPPRASRAPGRTPSARTSWRRACPVRPWVTHHAALEPARADAQERDAVAVGLVHVGLHLEDEAGHGRVERPGLAVGILAGGRRRDLVDRPRRAAGGRRSWSAPSRRTSASSRRRRTARCRARCLRAAPARRPRPSTRRPPPTSARAAVDELLGGFGGTTCGPGEPDEVTGATIDHAAEVAGDPDRPRDRRAHDRRGATRCRRSARGDSGPAGPTCSRT